MKNIDDMPESIYLFINVQGKLVFDTDDMQLPGTNEFEYIRKDIYDSMISKLDASERISQGWIKLMHEQEIEINELKQQVEYLNNRLDDYND